MGLTVDQMLRQAVAAHNGDNPQDAERLYRTILRIQPKHPDANHNLGLIAVAMNQAGMALPLFKNALKVNPNIEQFWLSYIEALISERQFENARRALKQGKKKGLTRENIKALTQKMISAKATGNLIQAPSQTEMQNFLNHYQDEHYSDAEKLAISITEQFPEHPFGWKALGAVLKQTNRISETLVSSQKVVEITPQDAEAHNNLGITLKELGRLEESEASLGQAIALKPDYAEAHSNLGITLQELGRLDEAEASYRQAIALKPGYVEALSNLGTTLQELGRLDESEASYRQAIALKPDYAEAHNNLGITLKELGGLEESEASLRQAIALKPDYAEAHSNLGSTLQELGSLAEAEASFRQAIALEPEYTEAHSNLGATLQALGRLHEAEASLRHTIKLKPDFAEPHNNLGVVLQELGRLEQAEESYGKAIALNPDYIDAFMNRWDLLFKKGDFQAALIDADSWDTKISRLHSLETLYALGRIKEIYQRIEIQSEVDHGDLGVAAFAAFIANKEKRNTANNFCNEPLNFLHFANISSYLQDANVFIKGLVGELHDVKTIWEPSKRATRKGFQTAKDINLFSNPKGKMAQLKSIIVEELDSYYFKFQKQSCSYIQKWPSEKNLSGWHVVLKKQGFQEAHIHSAGWLSGVIYLKVVPPYEKNEGAIEFSLNGEHYFDKNSPKLTHEPKAGDIVLFPSSLHHKTIPFTTDADRIIVSFNLKS